MKLRAFNYLGILKWPSIILVTLAPLVAFFFWLPPPPTRTFLGGFVLEGVSLCVYIADAQGIRKVYLNAPSKTPPTDIVVEVLDQSSVWQPMEFDLSSATTELARRLDSKTGITMRVKSRAENQAMPVTLTRLSACS